MSSIQEAEAYILGIPKFAAKIGTEKLALLMERLGNPHLQIKTIHIAGTNGKGSVAEMLRTILCEAGYRVGAFTSPHLVTIRERFTINGTMISEEDFVRYYERVREAAQGMTHPSFFEFVFAMAALYMKEQQVDYAIFETGMGGRLDATNLLLPEVSVITSIGFDHMQYLGDTIEQIAFEKAGIIKPGVPVVYHTGSREADRVIEKQAMQLQAPMISVEKSKVIINEKSPHSIDFSVENRYYKYYSLRLRSSALYQTDNAATAIAALHAMKLPRVEEAWVRRGLEKFFWPGRMEYLRDNLIIDGAHNEDAMERFVETLCSMEQQEGCVPAKQWKLLFAVSNDKDYDTMIRQLTEKLVFHTIYVTELHSNRGTAAEKVADLFRRCLGTDSQTRVVTGADIKQAEAELQKEETLFAVGSLYLVGEIKAQIRSEEHD